MSQTIPTFRLGDLRCRILCDGLLPYPEELLNRGLSDADRPRATGPYESAEAHINVPYTALLVETPRERILLDTGAGPLGPGTGRLPSLLESVGIAPESIAAVVLTHGHPDHIGGVADAAGRPRFPNARYLLGAADWKFWSDPATLDRCARSELYRLGVFDQLIGDWARRYLPALTGRLECIESETEIAPGVCVLPAPGHTPGHLVVTLASGGAQCLYAGDAFILPIQAELPDWNLPFDLSPGQAAVTRRALLDRAAADRMLVCSTHCPVPSLGRIEPSGSAWRWIAAEA